MSHWVQLGLIHGCAVVSLSAPVPELMGLQISTSEPSWQQH